MNSLQERLLENSEAIPFSGCWLWKLSLNNKGYGVVAVGRKMVLAHRESYREFRGAIPDGILVLHQCDTPACINPNHLFLGTYLDNILDMHAKGRRKYDTAAKGTKQSASKLNDSIVRVIRTLADEGKTHKEIAFLFGVSRPCVSYVVKRDSWKHVL